MIRAVATGPFRSARATLTAAAIAAFAAALVPTDARAQSEGGLYIAGAGFTFEQAAERGLAQNPGGRTFFVLALPPESAALTLAALPALALLRERVRSANGVLMVCQRDIDNRRINAAQLAPGVVAVRGLNAGGRAAGDRHFPGEDPASLPASDEALRRLRSTCAE
jgi:hypothetical protein